MSDDEPYPGVDQDRRLAVCPAPDGCGSARVEYQPRERTWTCKDCGLTFGAPDRRHERVTNAPTHGLARRLHEADPDAVGSGRLITDGGRDTSESGSYRQLPPGSTELETGSRLVSEDDGSVWRVVGHDDYDDLPIILKAEEGSS